MSVVSILVSLVLLTGSSVAGGPYPSSSPSERQNVPIISYCDLLKDQKLYDGKLVRLKASWRFGFETTCLYDPQCSELPKAWLEFGDEKDLCRETAAKRTVPVQSDKEAEVTVTGTLQGPGRYGHLGDYQFKFVVQCLEKIKVTSSSELK
jgi:hypothetical protein